MKKLTSQYIIDEYIEVGNILKETYLNGDFRRGNKEYKRIIKIFKALENDVDLARISLPILFSHENSVVRTKAAAESISLNICVKEAKNVLEEVSVSDESIISFNAEMTLKVWAEQGYIKVYPTQEISYENNFINEFHST